VLETVTGGSALKRLRNRGTGTNLGVLLPGSDRGGQGRFLGLSSNGGGIEQVSRALLGLFLSSEHMRDFFLLLGNGRTEFVCYPIERIVERDSGCQAALVNNLKRPVLHVPPTRNPLHMG
jgi:hypothetical protein